MVDAILIRFINLVNLFINHLNFKKNTKNMKIPKTIYKNTKEKMSNAPLELIALCDEIMYFGTTYKSYEVKFDRANMLYKYITFIFELISEGQSSPQFQIHHTTMNNKLLISSYLCI